IRWEYSEVAHVLILLSEDVYKACRNDKRVWNVRCGARVIKNEAARIRVNFTGQDTTHLYLWSLVMAVAEKRAVSYNYVQSVVRPTLLYDCVTARYTVRERIIQVEGGGITRMDDDLRS
ncbi:hypothetical protein J6590_105425, partial [Homalodisca vitripennis]